MDAATGVFVLVGSVDVAVVGGECALEARVLDLAASGSVEGHGVIVLIVHTLDNVNFSILGPVGAHEPEGRPHATNTARHVGYVRDEETLVPGLLGM